MFGTTQTHTVDDQRPSTSLLPHNLSVAIASGVCMPKHALSPGLWIMKTAHTYNAAKEASGKGQLQALQRVSRGQAMLLFPVGVAVFHTQSHLSSVLALLLSIKHPTQPKTSPPRQPQGSCCSQLGAPSLQLTKNFPSMAWCLPSTETYQGSRRGNTAIGISLSKSERNKKTGTCWVDLLRESKAPGQVI